MIEFFWPRVGWQHFAFALWPKHSFMLKDFKRWYCLWPHDGDDQALTPIGASPPLSGSHPSIFLSFSPGWDAQQLHQGSGLHDVSGGLRLRPQNHRGDWRLPRRRQLRHGERLGTLSEQFNEEVTLKRAFASVLTVSAAVFRTQLAFASLQIPKDISHMVSNPSSTVCTVAVHCPRHLKPCFPVRPQCGRAFDPNFLFLWPNARVSLAAPGRSASLLPPGGQGGDDLEEKLEEESSAFFSSARLWDDGVIPPQDTRKVRTQQPKSALAQLHLVSSRLVSASIWVSVCRFLASAWTSSSSSSISSPRRKCARHFYVYKCFYSTSTAYWDSLVKQRLVHCFCLLVKMPLSFCTVRHQQCEDNIRLATLQLVGMTITQLTLSQRGEFKRIPETKAMHCSLMLHN